MKHDMITNAFRAGYAQERYDIAKQAEDPEYDPYEEYYGMPTMQEPPSDPSKADAIAGGIVGAGVGSMIGAGIAGGRLIKPYRELAEMASEVGGKGTGLEKALLKDIRGKDILNVKGKMGRAALIGLPVGAVAGSMINKNLMRKRRENQAIEAAEAQNMDTEQI